MEHNRKSLPDLTEALKELQQTGEEVELDPGVVSEKNEQAAAQTGVMLVALSVCVSLLRTGGAYVRDEVDEAGAWDLLTKELVDDWNSLLHLALMSLGTTPFAGMGLREDMEKEATETYLLLRLRWIEAATRTRNFLDAKKQSKQAPNAGN